MVETDDFSEGFSRGGVRFVPAEKDGPVKSYALFLDNGQEEPIPERVSLEDFEFETQISEGSGQGRVFKAHHKTTRDSVAVKLYHHGKLEQWEKYDKAQSGVEKEVALLLKGRGKPDLLKLVGWGSYGPMELPFMVSRFEEHPTLDQIIVKESFNPTLEQGLALAQNVGNVLQWAHQGAPIQEGNGGLYPCIHRDVKPENIMVKPDDSVIVLDWASYKVGTGDSMNNTQTGTLCYWAPEALKGRSVSPATDVYGLAQVLKHYFCGQIFTDREGQLLASEFPSSIPDGVRDALMKATLEEPSERYESIDAFLEGLGAVEKKMKYKVVGRRRVFQDYMVRNGVRTVVDEGWENVLAPVVDEVKESPIDVSEEENKTLYDTPDPTEGTWYSTVASTGVPLGMIVSEFVNIYTESPMTNGGRFGFIVAGMALTTGMYGIHRARKRRSRRIIEKKVEAERNYGLTSDSKQQLAQSKPDSETSLDQLANSMAQRSDEMGSDAVETSSLESKTQLAVQEPTLGEIVKQGTLNGTGWALIGGTAGSVTASLAVGKVAVLALTSKALGVNYEEAAIYLIGTGASIGGLAGVVRSTYSDIKARWDKRKQPQENPHFPYRQLEGFQWDGFWGFSSYESLLNEQRKKGYKRADIKIYDKHQSIFFENRNEINPTSAITGELVLHVGNHNLIISSVDGDFKEVLLKEAEKYSEWGYDVYFRGERVAKRDEAATRLKNEYLDAAIEIYNSIAPGLGEDVIIERDIPKIKGYVLNNEMSEEELNRIVRDKDYRIQMMPELT